jgi:hypothetical protein
MGQYRFCIIFKRFIGFGVMAGDDDKSLSVWIPFLRFYIGLEKEANGICIFGKEL